MTYGIILWGNAVDVNNIFILQKRAIRVIYRMGPRESLKDKFKEIGIMTLYCQYIYENLLYVHKNIDQFKKNSDIHDINTRNKDKLAIPSTRLCKVNKSFKGISIKLYNKLPSSIKEMSTNKFKNVVKRNLLSKAYYCVNDYIIDKNAWT